MLRSNDPIVGKVVSETAQRKEHRAATSKSLVCAVCVVDCSSQTFALVFRQPPFLACAFVAMPATAPCQFVVPSAVGDSGCIFQLIFATDPSSFALPVAEGLARKDVRSSKSMSKSRAIHVISQQSIRLSNGVPTSASQ